MRAALIATLLALPPVVLAPLMISEFWSWLLIGFYLLFISSFAPLGLLAISGVSNGRVKGQMAAIHAFLMMLFGLTLGPPTTAFFTDFIFIDEAKLITIDRCIEKNISHGLSDNFFKRFPIY